jgi:hypothetical protein
VTRSQESRNSNFKKEGSGPSDRGINWVVDLHQRSHEFRLQRKGKALDRELTSHEILTRLEVEPQVIAEGHIRRI